MMRYTATLSTLRVDVASRDGAEAIARELPNNRWGYPLLAKAVLCSQGTCAHRLPGSSGFHVTA